jgi:hypothetical protein
VRRQGNKERVGHTEVAHLKERTSRAETGEKGRVNHMEVARLKEGASRAETR